MNVFVNNVEVEVHRGAHVRDALLKYDSTLLKAIEKGDMGVVDKSGDERMPDGALTEMEHIFLIKVKKK